MLAFFLKDQFNLIKQFVLEFYLFQRFKWRRQVKIILPIKRHFGTLCCLVIASGRSHQSGRGSVEISGIRVFSGNTNTREIEKFIAGLSRRGFNKIQARLNKLRGVLDDDLFLYLRQEKIGVRFLKKNVDLVDDQGYLIFRGTEKDVKEYLLWLRKADIDRLGDLKKAHARMQANSTISYKPSKALSRGVDVPPSATSATPPPWGSGTSPDFTGKTQHLYNAGVNAITKIRLTGSRSIDFNAAFRAIGITDRAEIKAILKHYTWHHLDDVNPHTLEASMQLISKKAHVATYTHYGGCHVVKSLLGMKKYR